MRQNGQETEMCGCYSKKLRTSYGQFSSSNYAPVTFDSNSHSCFLQLDAPGPCYVFLITRFFCFSHLSLKPLHFNTTSNTRAPNYWPNIDPHIFFSSSNFFLRSPIIYHFFIEHLITFFCNQLYKSLHILQILVVNTQQKS